MAKTVLSLDDINLLKNSEEIKNKELYGNLYEVLCNIEKPKAVTLEQLQGIDNLSKAALTYNKKTLIDIVIKEWYAEKVSEEDPSKKVRCGLCNTPNKYLYYIRNRKNGILLNVGSHCITKFPGIEGYIEQKKQLNQIRNGHKIVVRRNEFYEKFSNPDKFISDADKYFSTIPILLPYEIYSNLQNTITRMRLILTKYVNEGKKPFESNFSSFELFSLAIEQYGKLKIKADDFITNNINEPLICRRREINWMISNNRNNLLKQISENNGLYTKSALQQMDSLDLWKDKTNLLVERNISELFKFEGIKDNGILFSFNKFGYQQPILFFVPLRSFVYEIGADCIISNSYKYSSSEIKNIANILHTNQNLESIINYIDDIINNLNGVFLIDNQTNTLILYRKGDRAIRPFDCNKFIDVYSRYILLSDHEIKKHLFDIVKGDNNTKWITPYIQAKQGIERKITKLYNDYKSDHLYHNSRTSQNLEIVLYKTFIKCKNNSSIIDFDTPEYISISQNKLLISNYKKRRIDYGIKISNNSISPFYQNGDILLVHNTKHVNNGDILFYTTKEGLNIEKVCTNSKYEKIFSYIGTKINEVQAYGKVIYCLRNNNRKRSNVH